MYRRGVKGRCGLSAARGSSVKFLADENVDKPIVERFRKDGYVILYVIERFESEDDVPEVSKVGCSLEP